MNDPILTLSVAVAAGASLVAIGSRLQIPYIVLLLFGGILLGPEVLGVVQPSVLRGGLEVFVALAVAVILFEGGLTLDFDGYRRAPVVIQRLLTVGALITWLGTAGAAHLLYGFGIGMSLMLGSLVIVTGPTVISPLLRRLDIDPRLHHVLYWEGVLIDAVGVFVAVLCFEWLSQEPAALPVVEPLARFGVRVLLGMTVGVVSGLVIAFALNRNWVPDEHAAIFALGLALLSFGVSHWLLHETGVLVAVVAGLVVAWRRPRQLKRLKRFKLQVTELAIGVVFVLLSAKLDLSRFRGWRLAALVGAVLLLRPLSVAVATWGQGFRKRERAFLSWIAPRGIVAASMASLFSLRLEGEEADATMLETATYAVIAVTVTLQGLTAPWLARILRLKRPDRDTWALVGDELLVRKLGASLRRAGIKVVELVGDFHADFLDDPRFTQVRALLCVNATMLHNVWATQRWNERGMKGSAHRWATGEVEHEADDGEAVWSDTLSPGAAIEGLSDGSVVIDVVELGPTPDRARFDESFRPLFWVDDGRAELVDELASSEPRGSHAIVLRRRIEGLASLVAHVEVIDTEQPSFEETMERLLASAARLYPELPTQEVCEGIVERRKTMPTAVGHGIAIPHAFWGGFEESRCFVATVPSGVAGMTTPDGEKVRLVFLLISPLGEAHKHLEALATLARLAQVPAFVELLAEQKVPERLARFIMERG